MADHLFLSLKPPPPLIFAYFPYSSWRVSRRSSFSGGIRFSVRELRLANSTSPSHSSSSSSPSPPPSSPSLDSAPSKFDVVSTTQLDDGSHVFRFGDASEIERDLETEETMSSVGVQDEQAEIAEEASGVSAEQAVKEEDSVLRTKLEGPTDKCNSDTETVNSNVKSVKEKRAAPTNRSNVIKIKDRKMSRAPSKKKKEALNPANVSQHDDKVETKQASVSNADLEIISRAAIPKISGEEKVAISGESVITSGSEIAAELPSLELSSETHVHSIVVEKAVESEVIARSSSSDCSKTHDYPQITQKDVEGQTRPEFPTSELCSENNDLQEVAQEKTGIKVLHVSTLGHGGNLDAVEKPITDFYPTEKHFVEPTATAVASPDVLISTSGATHHGVDETAEKSVTDRSDVAMKSDDGEIVASITKEEITVVGDTKSDDVEVFAPDMTEPESIETASGREEIAPKGFYLDSGFASLQNPSKALAGREDAYFISRQSWLGVADGVSQWSFEGINAGVYAQELLSNCQKILSDETAQITDPVEVLSRSASETKSPGSSTALVAHFDTHELHIANVGDSGFMVIRNGTVLQKSSPMIHEFGFPMQLTQGDDPLKLAEVYRVNLDEGDVVITATDGLFDNLYEKEIASMVSSSLQQNLEPRKMAELLAAKAQEVGGSASARTPFADAAQAAGYAGYRGGKLDAVSVIVSLVRTR